MIRSVYLTFVVIVVVGLVGASRAADVPHAVNEAIRSGTKSLPKRILVWPSYNSVFQRTLAGEIEELPARTADSRQYSARAIRAYAKTNDKQIELVTVPQLSEEELRTVKEFVVDCAAVLSGAREALESGEAWKERLHQFDYSLGVGSPLLREKSGADAILIALGTSVIDSNGRAAVGFGVGMATALATGLTTGLAIFPGGAFGASQNAVRAIGVFDLETGDLLWMSGLGIHGGDMLSPYYEELYIEAALKTYSSRTQK